MLGYLMEPRTDVGTAMRKVRAAQGAKALAARRKMSRLEILAAAAAGPCICEQQEGGEPALYYKLCKQMMDENGFDGPLQQAVYRALKLGRGKKRNVFIVGDSDCAKSFVLKGLTKVFNAFSRPDLRLRSSPTASYLRRLLRAAKNREVTPSDTLKSCELRRLMRNVRRRNHLPRATFLMRKP